MLSESEQVAPQPERVRVEAGKHVATAANSETLEESGAVGRADEHRLLLLAISYEYWIRIGCSADII